MPGYTHGILVGGGFIGVSDGLEGHFIAVTPPQPGEDQPVGERGILREQAAVEVGADRVQAARAFGAVLMVVAAAAFYSPEGFLAGSQVRSRPTFTDCTIVRLVSASALSIRPLCNCCLRPHTLRLSR